MSGLQHASRRCSSAQFVVKADDDVMINVPLLCRTLALNATNSSFVGGSCNNVNVVRKSWFGQFNKWSVSTFEFPYSEYPRSCTGFFIMYSRDAARSIVKVAPHVPFFRFDDIYTTGLIGHEYLGIVPTHLKGIDGWVAKHYDWCKFKAKKIAVHLDRKEYVTNVAGSWRTLNACQNYTEVMAANKTSVTYTFPDWV